MIDHPTPTTILLQDNDTVNQSIVKALLEDMWSETTGNQNELEAKQATKKYLENKLENEPAEYKILELRLAACDFYAGYLKALTAHSGKQK